MKKNLLLILTALTMCVSAAGADVVERTYVSTDKGCYVAGDRIWMSAFCIDVSEGKRLSDFSGVAYVELVGADGTVQTGKIALAGGRGAGLMEIPKTAPTGNYRLIPYTALNVNEKDFDYLCCARTISVFNPYSTDRASVKIVSEDEYAKSSSKQPETAGNLVLSATKSGDGIFLDIENGGSQAASFSVSVYNDDGILAPESLTMGTFLSSLEGVEAPQYVQNRIPEYEGEIIRARIVGDFPGTDNSVFLSAPGNLVDSYSAPVTGKEEICFYTGNIFGTKEMVCEIEEMKEGMNSYVEILSPFVGPSAGTLPELKMGRFLSDAIHRRSVASQIERMFDSDTLYESLPARVTPLLDESRVIKYRLDDYTRFPTMEEVFVEFIPDIRTRKISGQTDIQVSLQDFEIGTQFSSGRSLMLVDGVPVMDHSKIMAYDPLLVESINIYPNTYYVGYRSFAGVVNFVTYKRNMPSMTFDRGARIITFHGAAVPQAYTCSTVSGNAYPDYRQTVYWHPLVSLESGKSVKAECKLPQYSGSFKVVVEGVTASGEPVFQTLSVRTDQ